MAWFFVVTHSLCIRRAKSCSKYNYCVILEVNFFRIGILVFSILQAEFFEVVSSFSKSKYLVDRGHNQSKSYVNSFFFAYKILIVFIGLHLDCHICHPYFVKQCYQNNFMQINNSAIWWCVFYIYIESLIHYSSRVKLSFKFLSIKETTERFPCLLFFKRQ